MSEDGRSIDQALGGLVARERVLGLFAWVIEVCALVLVLWALAIFQAATALTVGWGLAPLIGGLGLGALGTALLVRRRWSRAGSPLRQAGLVEGLRPELRGRLLTVAERPDGPRGQESADILALTRARAKKVLEEVPGSEVHPRAWLRPWLAVWTWALLAFVVAGVWGPVGPLQALAWLAAGSQPAKAAQVETPILVVDESALVGDLVLTYVYPEYTGLSPVEVPNSNGTAHGPPGTQVTIRARTADAFTGAALQVDDTEPTLATLKGGRDLQAGFLIEQAGVYRFLLRSDTAEQSSPDYAIEIDADQPPVVEVQAAREKLEVGWDEPIPLSWEARDDFGVTEAKLRIRSGKDSRDVPLSKPLDPTKELKGQLKKTPQALGLKPGDEVTLEVVGLDNDAVSGSKEGASRLIRIVVLGPKGKKRRSMALWRELRDAMVDALAPFAVEASPPAIIQRDLAEWAGEASGRLDGIDELVDKYWDGFQYTSLEAIIVQETRRIAGGLFRFVHEVTDPRSMEPVAQADLDSLEAQRQELIERLERNILTLDLLVRRRAVGDLNELAVMMVARGDALEQRAYAQGEVYELTARLSSLDRLEVRLRKAAVDADYGSLTDLVTAGVNDLDRLEIRIRNDLADEGVAGALPQLAMLADNLRRMARSIDHMQREMEAADGEMEDKIKELMEELARLETAERALLTTTEQTRRERGDQTCEEALWTPADSLGQEVLERTERAHQTLAEGGESQGILFTQVESAVRQAERLRRALGARDLVGARYEAAQTALRLDRIARRVANEARWPREGAEAIDASVLKDLERATSRSEQIYRLVERLYACLNTGTPDLAAAAQELGKDQKALHGETDEARDLAAELDQMAAPLGLPGVVDAIDAAVNEMIRAEDSLAGARVQEAEGAESAAADRLWQAQQQLSQGAEALKQLQEAMSGGPRGRKDDGEGSEMGDELSRNSDIEIPIDDMLDAEAYRKALLEGMKGEVPPEFEALSRRYYEELVRQ
jgi:hypothetical protein